MSKVSIIVPVYNVEKYLPRCLESLINQTYQDLEIICVNDCSPDNSQKIIDEYVEKYPDKIKSICNVVNSGLGKTRENGTIGASGQYIMYVDSDDFVEKNWVEQYVNAIETKDNLDMIIGGYTLTSENKKITCPTPKNQYSLYMCPSACCRIYKKDFLEKNNINFGGIRRSEDCYWTIMIALSNPKYTIIDDVGYHYWCNDTSITRGVNRKENQIEDELEYLHTQIFEKINFSHITEFQKNMVEYMFISNTFAWLFFYNRGCGHAVMKKKYKLGIERLQRYFPDFKRNSMVSLGKVKSGGFLCRNFVSVEMVLYKLKLGYLIYFFRAIL